MRLTALVLLLSALAFAAGCGGEEEESERPAETAATEAQPGNELIKGRGYTFEYPDELEPSEAEFLEESPGKIEQNAVFAGDFDLVAVLLYQLPTSVGSGDFDDFREVYDRSYRELVRDAKGTIASGPDEVEVDGLSGFEYTGTTGLQGGGKAETRTTILVDGDLQYYIECQWTPKHAETIQRACDVVLETFNDLGA